MAISTVLTTTFGEARTCYVRLNNMDVSNHDFPSTALFRGYISKEAFDSGSHYVWEKGIEMMADVSLPLWPPAYDALALELGIVNVEV